MRIIVFITVSINYIDVPTTALEHHSDNPQVYYTHKICLTVNLSPNRND